MDFDTESDFFDLTNLDERYDLEFKTAHGREGKGKLPRSLWESYSAMANTQGGAIILGVKEGDAGPEIVGVPEADKVIQSLFDQANDKHTISINLLSDRNIIRKKTPHGEVVIVTIPQADRKGRPVHVGKNPLDGTYRRNNEGDYRCTREVVEQMLGERVRDTQDGTILEGFNMTDIDLDSLRIYRQNFSNRKPDHVLNNLDGLEFLQQLGGYGRDRQTNKEGLTHAGLLMFGKLRSILDAVPRYVVDYQERPRAVTEARWIDRLTTDFSWSGNLYDFYRNVIGRLTKDLKIPFSLKGDERVEDTPVHEALREALVNTLIHADYSSNCSILVVKRPDLFGFRNPGLLRVPIKDAIQGGTSDCRNRNLQKMFQLVGLGEQSGFGFPKIYKNWTGQHWRSPELEERTETDQTILALRMTSLLPVESIADLTTRFGANFEKLSNTERIALTTAHAEGCVTHTRLSELSKEHARDLSAMLHGLVDKKMLQSEGKAKGTFYYLPGSHPIENSGAKEALGLDVVVANSRGTERDSLNLEKNSLNLEKNSLNLEKLEKIARPVRESGKAPKKLVRSTILELCHGRFLSLKEIAHLVNRGATGVHSNYIKPLLDEGKLTPEYPNIKNHPQQRYTTQHD